MKRKLLLFVLLSGICHMQAQNNKLWKSLDETDAVANNAKRKSAPNDYKVYALNLVDLQKQLKNAPERGLFFGESKAIVSLPNSDGELEDFRVIEASVFEAEVQAMYPEIRSYRGQSIQHPENVVAFSTSPYSGLSAMIRSGKTGKTTIIDPYSADNKEYVVFDKSKSVKSEFACTTVDDVTTLKNQLENNPAVLKSADDNKLRRFRLALSCTGEYANYFGATSASQANLVNAAYNATMTRVNGVFEMDFNATMVIIATNNSVIYYNAGTDPYSDGTTGSGGAWNNELQTTLTSVITEANYDVGHLFGASGGGGNAGCIGCVCNNGKGSGFTSPADGVPSGDTFDIDYVAHEMGHQFGGNHTFSHANDNAVAQKEPGSGTTIMGYAGITGLTDVQAHSDALFHAISIQQITANIKTKACPTIILTGNTTPTANAGADLTLPKGTPFKLTGIGTDADAGDALTYIWEQMDGGTPITTYPSITATSGPSFRSFTQTTSPTRSFPRYEDYLLNGLNGNKWEKVPNVARTVNFRFTVRDNKLGGSSNNSDDMSVTFSNTIGPFAVTSQNTAGLSYGEAAPIAVTWSVSGTTGLPGATAVNIKLSIDGGLTYPYTLAANTANDGTENLVLPAGVSAPFCRIMIEPTANVFYAINGKAFAVGYTVTNQCVTFSSGTLNAAVVEHNPLAYDAFSLNIPTDVIINDVNVIADVSHRPNQLYLRITHPDGTAVQLYQTPTSRGGGKCGNNDKALKATFDDSGVDFDCGLAEVGGSTFRPLGSLATLNGKSSSGNWVFRVADVDTVNPAAANSGVLNSFGIQICYQEVTMVTLGNTDFELQNFNLYPNPNNGSFNVNFTSVSSNDIKINVHDMRGRQVYEQSFSNTGAFNQNVNLDKVQAGIYLVTIADGEKKIVKRIVVE